MPLGQVDVSVKLAVNAGVGATAQKLWPGGNGALVVNGTFGGGNVQLQVLGDDGATWINVGAQITADGVQTFSLGKSYIRLNITTATGVYAVAERVLSA